MQTIIISGNLGKDAVLRQTQQGEDVLGFNVGVKQGWGDKASTNWFRCSVWGKRGKTLETHLRKGTRVFLSGELTVGTYEGKPQLDVRVAEIDFVKAGGGEREPDTRGNAPAPDELDDDVPF